MPEVCGNVDGQLELLLPPNGGDSPTRPSDIGMFELAVAPLQYAQRTVEATSQSFAFRLGGAEFCSAARRIAGMVEADDPVLIYMAMGSVTMIAGTPADAPVTYFEEYSYSVVGIPHNGLLIALKARLVSALAAFDSVFDAVVDLHQGTFVARHGLNCVRRGKLLKVNPSSVPHVLTPVARGATGGGHELLRQLSRVVTFAAKEKTYQLDRVVVEAGAAKASNNDTLAEVRHGHFGQVSYEIPRPGNASILKALAHVPASATMVSNGDTHLIGAEGRVVLWKGPDERVERDRLDASRFRSTFTVVTDRAELARTLTIFGVGWVASRQRVGLRLACGEAGLELWLESNHPDGIVCTHPHSVTVEELATDLPSETFFVDHVQLERVVSWSEADSLRIDISLHNGIATVIRVRTTDAIYLLGASKIATVNAPKRRRYQNR